MEKAVEILISVGLVTWGTRCCSLRPAEVSSYIWGVYFQIFFSSPVGLFISDAERSRVLQRFDW